MTPDLAATLDRAWSLLAAAPGSRDSPWRLPVLATADGDGADGRIVVLREVDRSAATLTFFTDRRASKVATVAAAPAVALLGYDPGERFQLRLRGLARIVTTGPAIEAAWVGVGQGSRRAYRTAATPGSSAPSAESAARLGSDDGRTNFALLIVSVTMVESLDLAGAIHRRARFCCSADGWTGEWLVP